MKFNNLYNNRLLWIIIFCISTGAISTAYYLQISLDLKPCFLCILQRIACIVISIGALFNIIKPYASKIKTTGLSIIGVGILAGVSSAIRHIYVQAHPIETFSCGPSVEFVLKNEDFFTAIPKLFKATGECQTIDWTFMGMTMPVVSLVVFSFILILCVGNKYLARK